MKNAEQLKAQLRRTRIVPPVVQLAVVTVMMTVLAPAAFGQSSTSKEPFFTVSTSRTFSPAQQPKVSITFRQVDHLDFRVYRVMDPVNFFSKLRDAHSFGGIKQELARRKTLLERFHNWKRDLRLRIRNFFRFQLQYQTRAKYHAAVVRKRELRKRIPLDIAAYAQVPLLNREQLVLGWRELLPRTRGTEYQQIPVVLHNKGLYLVEVTDGSLRAYTLLMITSLAMVSKNAPGQMLLYVVDRNTGVPVAGATTVVFNNHQEVGRANTDASGVSVMKFGQIKVQDAIMVAESGDDVAATSIESFWYWDTSATTIVGYLYTDRPVYRPTHEVQFKGIVRAREAGQFNLDVPRSVTVQVTDPTQKTVYQKELDLSPFGSFHGALTLSPLAALGVYQIVAHVGSSSVYGSFDVEEYKKPEFEVSVGTSKPRYLQGENIEATIEARYYFGEPVAQGKVKYSVYRAGYTFPYWRILWGGEDFEGDDSGPDDSYYGGEISQGTGVLDSNGRMTVRIPTEVDESGKRDATYRIEAQVMDASNRDISGGHSVLATYSTVVIILDTDSYVYRAGDQANVTVRTLDYDSKPISAAVNLAFYTNVYSSPTLQPWRQTSSRKQLGSATVTTDANGVAHYQYSVPSESDVTLVGMAVDSNQRQAHFETSLWVAGAEYGEMAQRYQSPDIYLDKHFYHPGDTAHVLIVTHKPGANVLVTTEGQRVYTWSTHTSDTGSVTVDVPIEERDEPNFFIGVAFVKDEQLFENTKNVAVPPADKILNVSVATDKAQYKPGEKVTYTVTTRNSQGKPVSAEVSLGVVDEAIYAVRPDATPPPDKVFYARGWNQVQTQFSTVYWFTGYSGSHRMELARLRAPTPLADFKNPAQLVQPKVRKYFPDTIYWMPSLVTDSAGQARATFTWPDSLTTWRATVRAVTANTLVGQVIQKVITRKNLILRLDVPRFLTQGDTMTVTGIVHNYLMHDTTAHVSLAAKGVELESPAESTVNIPQRGEATVTWNVRASSIGAADFLGKALTNEESDALELTIPVHPWGLQLNAARSGTLSGDKGNTTQTLALPPDINPGASTLRIDLAPSVAGTMMSALDYLSTYPYGCVEQTMSSFLPDVLVAQAVKELGLKAPPPSVELESKIAAGLRRLYQFQHDDGGWGWWETDETHPFMTAYVVAGLAQARGAGYTIDEERLERGRESLVKQLNENQNAVPDILAYMIYALETSLKPGMPLSRALEATRKDLPANISYAMQQRLRQNSLYNGDLAPNLLDNIVNSGDQLSPYGNALLALAFARMEDQRAPEFVKRLEQTVKQEGPYASWRSEREFMLDFSTDNSFEATAFALKALAHLDPKSDLLPKAARWLIDRRSDGYYWTSTEQTATAIFGLIDYLKVSGELKPNYTLGVYVNGRKLAERHVTEKDVQNPLPITITADATQLHAGANEVRITKSGPGVLYWSAFASYFTREPKPAPVGATSLNVVRQYFKLVPEKDGNQIFYTEQSIQGPVNSGDVIEVRLTVSATGDEQYLQIEDPIPAGFEFVEQESLYPLKQQPPWWDYYYTRREFHDDRAALFSTTFRRGQGQFHYLLKAVEPGTYQANPARVLPMYDPARQSSTNSMTVTISNQRGAEANARRPALKERLRVFPATMMR
ncbi:MAG TPA: MG2 domain-containing protein [Terriglobia bacterium]|nr:MG2 domain-containing protein [Terriglobia bacterium]